MQESSVEGLSGQSLRFAHYILRIPQEKAAQLKERTAELGNVLRTDSSVQNVTDEYYDIEARLKSLRTPGRTAPGAVGTIWFPGGYCAVGTSAFRCDL